MSRLPIFTVVAMLTLAYAEPAAALSEETAGDIVTGIIPFATYYIANSKDDDEGEKQFLRSTATSLVVNSALRLAFNKTSWGTRPNGHPYGFPSGHAGFVTSSAAFLQDRYGWKYGAPAYALVGYVTYVRVDTNHHRWRDVIAGVGVSYSISKWLVTRQEKTQIAPVIGPDTIGFTWRQSF